MACAFYQGRAPRKKEKVLLFIKTAEKPQYLVLFPPFSHRLNTTQRKMVVAIFCRFYYRLPPFCIFQIVSDSFGAILIDRNRLDSGIF